MDVIHYTATQAEKLTATFATRLSILEKLIEERRAKEDETAERYARTGTDGSSAVAARQIAQRAALSAVNEYRRTLVESTDKERIGRLRKLQELEEVATAHEPLYRNPQQLLSRASLGSPERTNYQEQLRHAGPRELENHAKWAMAHGDKILAAAVLSRIDAMPTKSRPMNTREFAEVFVGEEFEQLQSAFRRTRLAAQRAINANRDFERGQVRGVSKIALGLAARR